MSRFTLSRVSGMVWKVVEDDRFKQYPFFYLVIGDNKIVVIDTGCGTGDTYAFIKAHEPYFNPNGLPYLVLLTHVHFDHIGGVRYFVDKPDCMGVYMGNRDQTFTNNFEISSLALAHHGAKVEGFKVTKWLSDRELIPLCDVADGATVAVENAIQVIFTPGHTPDSVAFYLYKDNRVFIGDSMYPYTVIHLDCIGSNIQDYWNSVNTLIDFVKAAPLNQSPPVITYNVDQAEATAPTTAPVAPTSPYQEQVNTLSSIICVDVATLSKQFDPHKLMALCDGSVENAVNMYLSMPQDIAQLAPPASAAGAAGALTSSANQASKINQKYTEHKDKRMSCGHVSDNLAMKDLEGLKEMITAVKAGTLKPQYIDQGYGEYSNGYWSIMLPLKAKWNE